MDIKPYSYHRNFVSLNLLQKTEYLPTVENKYKKTFVTKKITQNKYEMFVLPQLS
jgi:hypothetical protein